MSRFTGNSNILNERGVENYEEAIELAYQITLKKTLRDPSTFNSALCDDNTGRHRIFLLKNNDKNDRLYITCNTGKQVTFSQIRFYKAGRLKQDIIQFYKPLGFFVKGPREMDFNVFGENGEVTNVEKKWVIDLFRFSKNDSDETSNETSNETRNVFPKTMVTDTTGPISFMSDDET